MTGPKPGADRSLVFDVLAEIAAGATARVDLCRVSSPVSQAGELIAVKRLHPHIAEDAQFADMFFDEVWLTDALTHPNVVRVVGWGTDDEGTYLAVELVQGVSLARLMKTVFDTGEVFSERMIVYIAAQLCAGLSAAHKLRADSGELLQLVHRDLTPGNILCGFEGDCKIADFGLAKAKQRVTKTVTGLLKGAPQYMSPEQSRGLDIDGRSDLFSLGVMLFELFAGRRPWSGRSELQVMHEAANEAPADLFELRPKIDKELVYVVNKLLEKDPNKRFQTADEVGERMREWLNVHGYREENAEALGRFVRRNAMRQMRWFERAVSGEIGPMPSSMRPSRQSQRRPLTQMSRASPSTPPGPDPSDRDDDQHDKQGDKRAAKTSGPRNSRGARAASGAAPAPTFASRRGKVAPPVALADIKIDDLVDETTEVDDSALKVAALHARLRQLEEEERDDDVDEGPTLVKRADSSRSGIHIDIHDEDSDQRPTAVKKKRHHTGATAPAGPQAMPRGLPRVIQDPDSEEAPTVPIKGERGRAVAEALAAASVGQGLPGEVVKPSPGVPPPPIARRVDVSQVTKDLLVAEASRLAELAAIRHQQAQSIALEASRRRTAAEHAAEAKEEAQAALAALTQGREDQGAVAAALERAYALEASSNALVSTFPKSRDDGPGQSTGHLAHPSPAERGADADRSGNRPSFVPMPESVPARSPMGSVPPPMAPGSLRPPPLSIPPPSAPPSAVPNSPGSMGAVSLSQSFLRMTGVDIARFRKRLKPTIYGMPTPVALGVAAAGAFFLVCLVVFVVF